MQEKRKPFIGMTGVGRLNLKGLTGHPDYSRVPGQVFPCTSSDRIFLAGSRLVIVTSNQQTPRFPLDIRFTNRPRLRLGTRVLSAFVTLCGICFAETGKRLFDPAQVEAVFLVNFCRFTKWSEQALAEQQSALTIGIWGDEHFYSLVKAAAEGERVSGRRVEVKAIVEPEDIRGVNLLFVSPRNESRFEEWNRSGSKNILYVGNSEKFLHHGGHIEFVIAENRVRLRVNLDAIKESNLLLSSSLLRIVELPEKS